MKALSKAALACLGITFGAAFLAGSCAGTGIRYPTPPIDLMADNRVVPGVRIGNVALGMTSTELVNSLGRPDRSAAEANGLSYSWSRGYTADDRKDPLGVKATVLNQGLRVWKVRTRDPLFATVEGVRRGQNAAEVEKLLGKPDRAATHDGMTRWCYARGLFVVIQDQPPVGVVELTVQPPGC